MSDDWKKYLKRLAIALVAGLAAHYGQLGTHGDVDWRLTLGVVGAIVWAYITNPNNPLPPTPPWDGIERRTPPAGPTK